MTLLGMLIAIVVIGISLITGHVYLTAFLFILLFGMVFSMHQKNKQILEDLKAIREKLNLLTDDEKMKIELDRAIAEYQKLENDPQKLSKLNEEIEAELESYVMNNDVAVDQSKNEKEKD